MQSASSHSPQSAGAGNHRLRRRLYAFSFSDEFGPLYAIYPLWFSECGLSIGQISTVFIVWGTTELVCEVPSGALADGVDRRRLIAFALGLRALGIGIWFCSPSFAGALIGAALWAMHSALASGAWEALVYDELAAHDEKHAYGPVMARIGQASHSGIALSTLLASLLLWAGFGIAQLGWLTLLLAFPAASLILSLPRVAPAKEDDDLTAAARETDAAPQGKEEFTVTGWLHTLKNGLRHATERKLVARLALLGAVLGGLFIVDEYMHLVARERGAPAYAIPLIVAVVWAGLLLGGELAARRPNLSPATLAALLAGGAAIMATGLLAGSPWPLLLIAVGYGALQTVWVITDARFQAVIPSVTRATVTSIRALGSGLVSVVALALIGALAQGDDPSPGLVVVAAALAGLGVAVRSWVPKAS